MLKRILDAWPYALAVVIGLIVWPIAISAAMRPDPSQAMGVIVLWIYILQPLALLIGGLVLGFRRGFDWLTAVVCLVVYVVGFGVLGLGSSDPEFFTSYIGPSIGVFAFCVLIGMAVGVGVRAANNRSRADNR